MALAFLIDEGGTTIYGFITICHLIHTQQSCLVQILQGQDPRGKPSDGLGDLVVGLHPIGLWRPGRVCLYPEVSENFGSYFKCQGALKSFPGEKAIKAPFHRVDKKTLVLVSVMTLSLCDCRQIICLSRDLRKKEDEAEFAALNSPQGSRLGAAVVAETMGSRQNLAFKLNGGMDVVNGRSDEEVQQAIQVGQVVTSEACMGVPHGVHHRHQHLVHALRPLPLQQQQQHLPVQPPPSPPQQLLQPQAQILQPLPIQDDASLPDLRTKLRAVAAAGQRDYQTSMLVLVNSFLVFLLTNSFVS